MDFNQGSKSNRSAFGIGGIFTVRCYDSDGNLKWEEDAKNAVVNDGLDSILDLYFRNGTTLAAWALGLINGPGPTLGVGDTHASHVGWTEFVSYSEIKRPQWAPNAPTSQQLVNPSPLNYSINGVGTVSGVFIVGGSLGGGTTDADTKSSTDNTPLLWAHALFTGGNQPVANGDTLRVTYTISAAST